MKNPSIASDNEVSDGQIETCVTLVTDATRKATGTALRGLAKNGVLNKVNIEKVRARGNEVVAAITTLVKEKFAEIADNILGYVKLISGAETLTLEPTDGTETIVGSSDLFTGYLDPDFKSWGTNVPSPATKKVNVSVHEIVKNGTFAQIFAGMNTDLNNLCLTQPQIIQFVKKYRQWLHTEGYGTFFLFKVGGEFFVARVPFHGDQLRAYVRRRSYSLVWRAGHRCQVVIPQ